MSTELDKAIEALTQELSSISERAVEVKKAINQLYALKGEVAPYDDVEFTPLMGKLSIAPDQFFGKGFATAVKEYLKMKRRAATAQDIFDALQKGGFEFPENWGKKHGLKNVAISLSKNRADFVPVPTSNGTAFGLYEFYPEKKKKRLRRGEELILETIKKENQDEQGEE